MADSRHSGSTFKRVEKTTVGFGQVDKTYAFF